MFRYALTLVVILAAVAGVAARAATTKPSQQLLLTWSANGFVPSQYLGRVMPSDGSTVNVAAQIIDSDRLVAKTDAVFRWYINNQLIAADINITNFTFQTSDYPSNNWIRVVVSGYPGVDSLEANLFIPQSNPLVVITTPYPNGGVNLAGSILEALPYFFPVQNIEDLAFSWQIGGQTQSTPGNRLLISGENKSKASRFLQVGVTVNNKVGSSGVATGVLNAFAQ